MYREQYGSLFKILTCWFYFDVFILFVVVYLLVFIKCMLTLQVLCHAIVNLLPGGESAQIQEQHKVRTNIRNITTPSLR